MLPALADSRRNSPPRSPAGVKRPGSPFSPVDDLIAVGERKVVKKSDRDSDDNRIKMQPTANGISNNTTVSERTHRVYYCNLLSFWQQHFCYGSAFHFDADPVLAFSLKLIRIRIEMIRFLVIL